MSILDVLNLSLNINTEKGAREVLHNVSFSLNDGELHAIVGESGCGKTLSAMSILRLLPKNAIITNGSIYFENTDLLKYPLKEMEHVRGAKIALIPQDSLSSLNPLYTIGNQLTEVIQKHQHIYGKQAYNKAIEALESVQIPQAKDRLNSYPHEFSGGMRQRAIIAMALACNAKVLIADEPTTALDVTIQAQIMELLNQIKQNLGTSIILITHDLALVEGFADRVSVMYSGRIVESCNCREFYANPLHPYSRALLKALPDPSKKELDTIKGQAPSIYEDISGCKFHPRCEEKLNCCTENIPVLKEIYKNHFVACHLI